MDPLAHLESQATAAFEQASSTAELREFEIRFLGKSGLVTGLMRTVGSLPAAERPTFGQAVNAAKARLAEIAASRFAELERIERAAQFEQERIDVTLPGRPSSAGLEHPLQQAMNRIKSALGALGFEYVEGPELEHVRYNFDALNYPPDHPALDEQDTFYVTDDRVLRTQCTALQGRTFERREPPIRTFTIGRCYRNESVDRTHGHTFHQVDCFMVDEGVSMAHLRGTLEEFARRLIGPEAKVRFRPDFFPFVEPGVDYAISTPRLFDGKWLELGGAGLIHPNILERYGFDSERYSGFAFGLGVERIPMMAYGIEDLRFFMENDLRFLEQFRFGSAEAVR